MMTFHALTTDPMAVFLFELLVKTTIILLFGMLLTRLAARGSAAIRHRIWCLCFVAMLALPVLSLVVPGYRVPLLPAAAGDNTDFAASERVSRKSSPSSHTGTPETEAMQSAAVLPANAPGEGVVARRSARPTLLPARREPSEHAAVAQVAANSSRMSWQTVVGIIWTVGAGMLLLPLISGLLQNRWLAARASEVSDPTQRRLLESLCDSLNLRRSVRLLEIPRALIPMTWGVLRPVVVFPEDWNRWDEGSRRFALLHELAHVKRFDVGFQLLGRLVCCLYWFHPLSWYALRQLRVERELACDDCVVDASGHAKTYARELIRIARRCQPAAMPAAVAMAQTSDLERRVRALLDAARSHMPMSRRLAGALALSTCLVATGIGAVRVGVRHSDRLEAMSQDGELALKYRGNVVDEQGRPVSGARVYRMFWKPGMRSINGIDAVAVTDASGQFEYQQNTVPGSLFYDELVSTLVVRAPGFGVGKARSVDHETTGQLKKYLDTLGYVAGPKTSTTITLESDVPLSGRVLTVDGQPVAGATIRIDRIWTAADTLDAWESDAQKGGIGFWDLRNKHRLRVLNGRQLPAIIKPVTSDQNGRFALSGIGADRIALVYITGPGIEASEVYARTRKGDTLTLDGGASMPVRCHAIGFTHIAGPSGRITGRITDADTGEPLPGVRVAAGTQSSQFGLGKDWLATVTDENGHYELDGLALNHWESIAVEPAQQLGYLPAGARTRIRSQDEPGEHNFVLRKGRWLRGAATEKATGKPIAGYVRFYADAQNKHLDAFPQFARSMVSLETLTNSEGQFELAVPPGAGIVGFTPYRSSSYGRGLGAESIQIKPSTVQDNIRIYQTYPRALISTNETLLTQVDIADDEAPTTAMLEVPEGRVLRGTLQDGSGKPLSGCLVNGVFANRSTWAEMATPEFRINGVYPTTRHELFAYHPGRNLAGHAVISGSAEAPVLTLEPAGSVTGQLVNDEGGPISTLLIGTGIPAGNRLKTDNDGRFTVHGLIPGRKYTLRTATRGQIVFRDVTVEAGETNDLGKVRAQPDAIASPRA